jgi:TetR/AcrR family transcriptional repressor of mexJK operon
MRERRGPGRPKDQTKGDAILDAAWDLFLERGVGAVSIEAIAARAGVAKMTVYKHFSEKHELFEAAVLRKRRAIEAAQAVERNGDEEVDLEGKLRAFGVGIMSFLATDFAIDFNAVLYAELGRHPELARTFFDGGPAATVRNLAELLSSANDRLAVDDPVKAAEALIGLWQGVSNYQLASRLDVDEFRKTLADRVDYGIGVFMRAFARSTS